MKLEKYKENLRVHTVKGGSIMIESYETLVGTIDMTADGMALVVRKGYKRYSATTSKHINYAAGYFGVPVVYADDMQEEPKEPEKVEHKIVEPKLNKRLEKIGV